MEAQESLRERKSTKSTLKALKITWGEIGRPLPTVINQPNEYQRKKNGDGIHKPINYRLNKLGVYNTAFNRLFSPISQYQ